MKPVELGRKIIDLSKPTLDLHFHGGIKNKEELPSILDSVVRLVNSAVASPFIIGSIKEIAHDAERLGAWEMAIQFYDNLSLIGDQFIAHSERSSVLAPLRERGVKLLEDSLASSSHLVRTHWVDIKKSTIARRGLFTSKLAVAQKDYSGAAHLLQESAQMMLQTEEPENSLELFGKAAEAAILGATNDRELQLALTHGYNSLDNYEKELGHKLRDMDAGRWANWQAGSIVAMVRALVKTGNLHKLTVNQREEIERKMFKAYHDGTNKGFDFKVRATQLIELKNQHGILDNWLV